MIINNLFPSGLTKEIGYLVLRLVS